MAQKISVITINYNDKEGLEKTLQNVTNQKNADFEFIVIDGASSDGSKELIEHYADKIDYWISEPDKGIYNAMNKGILAAKGDFLIFMNSRDTFYDENVLATVSGQLTADHGIYYGDTFMLKTNSKRRKTFPEKLSFSFFYSSCINHQSTFIKRQLFFDHFLYNESYKIVADWEFFIYTICHQNVPYKYLNCLISNYDYTGISSTNQYDAVSRKEKQQTFEKYFPLFIEDYKRVAELNSKRIGQVFHIKEYPIAWKVLKGMLSFLTALLPKKSRTADTES
ncbi:glycosyltransferase family 2 protein [Flavobacterium kingsejongi]|uniref:Glycosyl transferase n=1 Tax=Flavobacterium kingsejongi TaxID=1678728 RepID=A0A2S1LQ97_9FLAO|nr:glycosyltransferase family 2 protein [Flavobacterium kingsejongi]AWG25933.1 glycosyl transferase [Flavobacterium kingsejongi]